MEGQGLASHHEMPIFLGENILTFLGFFFIAKVLKGRRRELSALAFKNRSKAGSDGGRRRRPPLAKGENPVLKAKKEFSCQKPKQRKEHISWSSQRFQILKLPNCESEIDKKERGKFRKKARTWGVGESGRILGDWGSLKVSLFSDRSRSEKLEISEFLRPQKVINWEDWPFSA